MFYECHPSVCPTGEHCLNRRFQLRQYPAVKPFRTDSRGWGLMTCVDIAKVCGEEYVDNVFNFVGPGYTYATICFVLW